jgi:hypothetical protein
MLTCGQRYNPHPRTAHHCAGGGARAAAVTARATRPKGIDHSITLVGFGTDAAKGGCPRPPPGAVV